MKLDKWLEKKNQWVILILVGLLAVVIAWPAGEEEQISREAETALPAQTVPEGEVEALERRLRGALETAEGVGKTEVMITMEATGKKTVEKDGQSSLRISEDAGQNSGGVSSTEQSDSDSTVYETAQDGSQTPYITQETALTVRGVLVVAQGGGDPVVAARITDAAMALFGIDAHKIKVMKMS